MSRDNMEYEQEIWEAHHVVLPRRRREVTRRVHHKGD